MIQSSTETTEGGQGTVGCETGHDRVIPRHTRSPVFQHRLGGELESVLALLCSVSSVLRIPTTTTTATATGACAAAALLLFILWGVLGFLELLLKFEDSDQFLDLVRDVRESFRTDVDLQRSIRCDESLVDPESSPEEILGFQMEHLVMEAIQPKQKILMGELGFQEGQEGFEADPRLDEFFERHGIDLFSAEIFVLDVGGLHRDELDLHHTPRLVQFSLTFPFRVLEIEVTIMEILQFPQLDLDPTDLLPWDPLSVRSKMSLVEERQLEMLTRKPENREDLLEIRIVAVGDDVRAPAEDLQRRVPCVLS